MEPLNRPRNRACGYRGLTMLELLVVAAIIALLLALLLPTLARARMQSRSVGCVTNLRAFATAVEYIRADTGSYPHCSASRYRWADPTAIGELAERLVREAAADPNTFYCPVSLQDDPCAGPPMADVNLTDSSGRPLKRWQTGEISYIYLPGITYTYPDPSTGRPTFDPERESPDRVAGRAVVAGDRTVVVNPKYRSVEGSNHGRYGGWFYFTGGEITWRRWDTLTAHPTNFIYTLYWPKVP